MMGRAEEAKRQAQATMETLMETVRRHPDDTYARSLLAAQLVLSGEKAAGVAQAERTLEISPHDGRLRYNAACTFARAGLPERALAELKEGVRGAHVHLGLAAPRPRPGEPARPSRVHRHVREGGEAVTAPRAHR